MTRIELTPEDLTEIRDMMMGNINFEVSDDDIRMVIAKDSYSYATAHDWGWDDTEVRERVCAALEKLHAARGGA